MTTPVLVLHGGAGVLADRSYEREIAHLTDLAERTRAALLAGQSALDAVVQQTREERRTLEDEAAVMEDRLRMAVRDRRILETLKEARLAAHRDAGRRREAKRMDFLATTTRREAAL